MQAASLRMHSLATDPLDTNQFRALEIKLQVSVNCEVKIKSYGFDINGSSIYSDA